VTRPISAVFVAMCVILIGSQIYFRMKGGKSVVPDVTHGGTSPPISPELTPQRVPVTPAE
jgi:hypothetical protein